MIDPAEDFARAVEASLFAAFIVDHNAKASQIALAQALTKGALLAPSQRTKSTPSRCTNVVE